MKLVLEMKNGRIKPVEKIRAKTKALDHILELVTEGIGRRVPVRIATVHSNAEEEAQS